MLLGGGLNQFVSQGFICKKIKNLSNNELKLNRYEAKTRRDRYIYMEVDLLNLLVEALSAKK